MNRRDILKYTAYATGAALSAPLISSLLVGCKVDSGGAVATDLHFFTQKEFSLLKELVDTILPKTDSPSASEVGVDHMIDTMVGTVYPEEARTAYRKGFDALAAYLTKSDDKLAALQKLETASGAAEADLRSAYLHVKQQTVAYYLTSEEIGTNYLNYLPVPGKYEACISLEEAGGKAWAL